MRESGPARAASTILIVTKDSQAAQVVKRLNRAMSISMRKDWQLRNQNAATACAVCAPAAGNPAKITLAAGGTVRPDLD
jgi:hypothetical protein